MTFLVWDELNAEETEGAKHIKADTAEEAAVIYGEQDSSGWTDGLYTDGCAQPVSVRAPDGTLSRFDVSAEMVPYFDAAPAKGDS